MESTYSLNTVRKLALLIVIFFEIAGVNTIFAQFNNNNLAVLIAAASVSNTTVSVAEIQKSGSNQMPVQTIAIPGTGTNAIRVSGSATSTLYAANTNDGSLFSFTGANSTNTTSNANTLNPRAVVTLDNSGNIVLQTTYTGSSGNQTRSATSINNTNWFIGDQGGFYTNGATSASPSGNVRSVKVFGGTVYGFTSTTSAPPVGIISAPSGGTYTALTGLPNGATSRQDFYMLSSGSNGSVYDVLYVLDATSASAGTIFKYALVAGSWVSNGTYSTSFGGFGIVAENAGSGANIYITTGTGATTANSVIKLTDVAGYNTTINITTGNNVTLFTTASGTIIKGLAFAPKAVLPPVVPVVTLGVSSNTGSEASATEITVTATADSPVTGIQSVVLNVTGTGITAGDYTLSNTSIAIPDGGVSGSVTFTVVNDADVENTETAVLAISNPTSGITVGNPSSQNVVITDNDTPAAPAVNLSVSSNEAEEALSSVVTLTVTSGQAVTGNQTVSVTIAGTGITGSDYFLSNTLITILDGQSSGTATFVVADDGLREGNETAIISIGSPTGGIVLGSTTTQNVTIKENNCSFLVKSGTVTSINGAEIPAFDATSSRLYVVAGNTIEYYHLNSAGIPVLEGSLAPGFSPPANTNIIPNSVSVKNGILAVAYAVQEATTLAQQQGVVTFFNASTGVYLNHVQVGFLPDMVIFTPDGNKVLTANEGEPNSYGQGSSFDPEGSVSIIDISGGVLNAAVQTAGFTAFNGQITALRSAGVRIYGPGATVAQDLEPEYIAFSDNGLFAYVTLQENNAFGVLDINTATFTDILPLGQKNHNISGSGFDASDRDLNASAGKINIQNWPVFGMYQPDAIAGYTVNGQRYYITANEGDSRAYTGFSEEIRVGAAGYVLDAVVFPNAATLKLNENLGRLQLTNATGDTDSDGDFDRIDAFGCRSFSVWDSNGNLVFDSGDLIEQITALKTPGTFNSEGSAATFDTRSDNKGPEPEGVAIGYIQQVPYAFIGLERSGDVMVFNIENPSAPVLVQYINTPEDMAVEGLIFVAAEDSPTGTPLLITASEVSKTVTVYKAGTSVVTSSANDGYGSLRAAITCSVDGGIITYDQPSTSSTLLTSTLNIQKNIHIYGQSSIQKPEITVDFTSLGQLPGITIGAGKQISIKDVDVSDINNTSMPANALIQIEPLAVLKIIGNSILNRSN